MPAFVRTMSFDDHDQRRVRLPVKLVCNLLKQRLSFFVIPRNLIKGRTVGFDAVEESCSARGRAQLLPGEKASGELIVFKPAKGGARVGVAPVDHGTVVVFTGIWQERRNGKGSETKPARRVAGRRSGKSGGKPGGPQK